MLQFAPLRRSRRILWVGSFLSLVAAAGITAVVLPGSDPVCTQGTVLRDIYELAHRIRPELTDAQIAAIEKTTGRKLCLPPKLGKSYMARERDREEQGTEAIREGITPQIYRQ